MQRKLMAELEAELCVLILGEYIWGFSDVRWLNPLCFFENLVLKESATLHQNTTQFNFNAN